MKMPAQALLIGKPSARAQAGELESATLWISRVSCEGLRFNPIYDRLFDLRELDYTRLRILDVGSGPLSVFETIAPAGADIVPYDTLAVEYNRIAPEKKFPVRATIPDGRYSLVTLLNCLDHMDEPEELLVEVARRLAADGRVLIYCNIDQPFDPILHPQDFKAWQLVLLIQHHLDIVACGLVREGRLFPYAWWGCCVARRQQPGWLRAVWSAIWIAKCAVTYARFHAVRAAVKAVKILGMRRLLPPELRF